MDRQEYRVTRLESLRQPVQSHQRADALPGAHTPEIEDNDSAPDIGELAGTAVGPGTDLPFRGAPADGQGLSNGNVPGLAVRLPWPFREPDANLERGAVGESVTTPVKPPVGSRQVNQSSPEIPEDESPFGIRRTRHARTRGTAIGRDLVGPYPCAGHGLATMIDDDSAQRHAALESNRVEGPDLVRLPRCQGQLRRFSTRVTCLRHHHPYLQRPIVDRPARDVGQAITAVPVGRRPVAQLVGDLFTAPPTLLSPARDEGDL